MKRPFFWPDISRTPRVPCRVRYKKRNKIAWFPTAFQPYFPTNEQEVHLCCQWKVCFWSMRSFLSYLHGRHQFTVPDPKFKVSLFFFLKWKLNSYWRELLVSLSQGLTILNRNHDYDRSSSDWELLLIAAVLLIIPVVCKKKQNKILDPGPKSSLGS